MKCNLLHACSNVDFWKTLCGKREIDSESCYLAAFCNSKVMFKQRHTPQEYTNRDSSVEYCIRLVQIRTFPVSVPTDARIKLKDESESKKLRFLVSILSLKEMYRQVFLVQRHTSWNEFEHFQILRRIHFQGVNFINSIEYFGSDSFTF
jgi:hypothetical protein